MKQLRLYWGENYAPKSKRVLNIVEKGLRISLAHLHLYPGDQYKTTATAIAKYCGVKTNQILLGNGVESLIHIIARTYISKSAKVATLSPSFGLYEVATKQYGGSIVPINIDIGEKLNVKKVIRYIKNTKLFLLAYPNNPTGQYVLSVSEIDSLLTQYAGILVVDECYVDIGGKSVLPLLRKHKNLIILRSISKCQGLAGLRFGYVIAHPEIISQLSHYCRDIDSDSVNIFSHDIVPLLLPEFKQLAKEYIDFKTEFLSALKIAIPHLTIIPSFTTFILVQTKLSAQIIIQKLKEVGILIKDTTEINNFPSDVIMFAVPRKQDWRYLITHLKTILISGQS